MDKKRRLTIKHPHLPKVRDALRKAIVDTTYKILNELRENEEPYDKVQTLQRALDASICKCAKCASSASDMIYNPQLEKWFCVDCYEELHEWYKTHPNSTESRHAPNLFP